MNGVLHDEKLTHGNIDHIHPTRQKINVKEKAKAHGHMHENCSALK